jgi:hypothetical protein
MPPAEPLKNDSSREAIVREKDSEPDVQRMKISRWLATPRALCVAHMPLLSSVL